MVFAFSIEKKIEKKAIITHSPFITCARRDGCQTEIVEAILSGHGWYAPRACIVSTATIVSFHVTVQLIETLSQMALATPFGAGHYENSIQISLYSVGQEGHCNQLKSQATQINLTRNTHLQSA